MLAAKQLESDRVGHTLYAKLPAKMQLGSEARHAQECGTAGREKLATRPEVAKDTRDRLLAELDLQAVSSTLPVGSRVIAFTAVLTGRVKKD